MRSVPLSLNTRPEHSRACKEKRRPQGLRAAFAFAFLDCCFLDGS
jgi:hypothetical protein